MSNHTNYIKVKSESVKKRVQNKRFSFIIIILAVVGAFIGGISIYIDNNELENATICKFNSFENVVLLESEKASDILAYLKYNKDKTNEMNFKWSPINSDVKRVYILESLHGGEIFKIKFWGRIVKSSSREKWIVGFVYKDDLKTCSTQN